MVRFSWAPASAVEICGAPQFGTVVFEKMIKGMMGMGDADPRRVEDERHRSSTARADCRRWCTKAAAPPSVRMVTNITCADDECLR
jgi:hypothetical protein